MWIARDKDGQLHCFYYKPYRVNNSLWTCDVPGVEASWHHWEMIVGYWMKLDDLLFPNLKWEDEPIEVELKVAAK